MQLGAAAQPSANTPLTNNSWSSDGLKTLVTKGLVEQSDTKPRTYKLTPDGEAQSLIPLLDAHPNLVVIRSLTKLLAVAGLRLGYALGDPQRLERWAHWRDPWPVNGLAAALPASLLEDRRWLERVHGWVRGEGAWLRGRLGALDGLKVLPSATSYLMLRGCSSDGSPRSLEPLRQALAERHHILLRDCRSFDGLDASWLRLSLQDRRSHRRLLRALRQEWPGA